MNASLDVLPRIALVLFAMTTLSLPSQAADLEIDRTSHMNMDGPARDPLAHEATHSAIHSKKNFLNALLWAGAGAGIRFGVPPKAHWTEVNSFDDELHGKFRLRSASGRRNAATASDVLLIFNAAVLPLAAIGFTAHQHSKESRLEAIEMTAEVAEALSLTLFITEATKTLAGRERPFVQDCVGPVRRGKCRDSARNKSFFSGHASLAAAGAGLACSHSIKRRTWGDSTQAKFLPCALGAGVAVTTGVLRMAADKHWLTDILVGLSVGGLVGYFDTWGPFDLLRFDSGSANGMPHFQGVVLPYAGRGTVGARLAMTF